MPWSEFLSKWKRIEDNKLFLHNFLPFLESFENQKTEILIATLLESVLGVYYRKF